MASDVMSLFGLDPNTIQQNRTNKAVSQASAMNPYFAAGAAGGALVGQSVNNMFGLQTPEMAQAQSVKDGMQGADLNTPEGMRGAAQQLMMSGDYAQAMALHSRANEMEAAGTEATRSTEDRALGKPRNVIITPASSNPITGTTTPAVTHSITEYPDGRIADATQGKEFNSYAEWMSSLRKGRKTPAGSGGDSTVANLSPSESEAGLDQSEIESTVNDLEEQLLFTSDEGLKQEILNQIENVKAGDPKGVEIKITSLLAQATSLYNELRAGGLEPYEIQNRSIELGKIKAMLGTLGATPDEISKTLKVTP